MYQSEFLDLFVDAEMEGKVLSVDCCGSGGGGAEVDDLKFISGLSTILVAHIQEVKDRVSQIELIFCRQLFPHFQAMSKLPQARVGDAVKANEDEWRKREARLLSQLEELSNGKQLAEDKLLQLGSSLEEMKGKLVDAERLATRHEAEKNQVLGRLEEEMRKGEAVRCLEREREEKAAEVAREREAHQRLLLQVELKDKDLVLEQSKRQGLIEDFTKMKTDFKHLKSQYTFLLRKIDQNQGSKLLVGTSGDQKGPESHPSKRKLKGTAL
jgi:splicing factor 4